jgi:hypothetical protein
MQVQKIVNAINIVVGDVCSGLSRGATKLRGRQRLVWPSRTASRFAAVLAIRVDAGEQVVAATDGNAPQSAFCWGVIDLGLVVLAVARHRRPQVEGVLSPPTYRVCVRASQARDWGQPLVSSGLPPTHLPLQLRLCPNARAVSNTSGLVPL